jgi:hypothetical protein
MPAPPDCHVPCRTSKYASAAKRRTKGDDQGTEGLDDGGVAEEGQDSLEGGGDDDEEQFARRRHVDAGEQTERHHGPDDENETFRFEADHGDPVQESHDLRPAHAGRPLA